MTVFSKLLREPLLHFLLLGALLFGLNEAVSPDERKGGSSETIRVSDNDVERLRARFEAVWTRSPNEQELENLTTAFVREEVLVREAIALSLDRDDTIIRQRLSQKMEFLLQSIADTKEPTESELRRHFDENIDAYRSGPRYAFDQVNLGQTENVEDDAQTILDQLRSGGRHTEMGQRSMLPMTQRLASGREIEASFGAGFSDALAGLPQGEWAGPVPSGFGLHLVKVTQSIQPEPPDFLDVQAQVEIDWRRAYVAQAMAEQFEILSAKYQIERVQTEVAQ